MILGVSQYDYPQLYKSSYTRQESYKLDDIKSVELGEKKDENPYETFRSGKKCFQSFITIIFKMWKSLIN